MAKIDINESLESIRTWALEGCTEKEIARRLGVSDRTFRRYKEKNGAILTALDNRNIEANMNVELMLLKCALGYEYEEEEVTKERITTFDEEGRKVIKEIPRVVKVKKKALPNIQAQKYWLNNRNLNHWKDNPHKVKNDIEVLELRKKELESKEW